ncbi:alpha/beta hydrolase [Congregibacter brevis]|uniref:Alpha/beta hydrolase n=1 Tax=Congregibacter brevis TaxID=3081201 RepID=A0ABZ0IF58_9GAMM|nr:alpha/beta hydrolase [Congregibacter sp. IMCC45268]
MSIKRKILISLSVAIVALMAYVLSTIIRFVSTHGVDRDQTDYQERLYFLWDSVDWVGERPSPTLDRDIVEYFGSLYNPLMERGPYLVSYALDEGENSVAVVLIPGGGYVFRSEQREGIKVAKWLNTHGIAAFVLNYRLDLHPAPVNDARLAIAYLRRNSSKFRIDPGKIGTMGFSAGGHLATSLVNLHSKDTELGVIPAPFTSVSARPDFNVLAYPVITFQEPYAQPDSRDNLVGESPSKEMIKLLSAELQVAPDTPPTFIWAPVTDEVVPYQNSQIYSQALAERGIENELHLFDEGKHGSDLAEKEPLASQWPDMMLKWLDQTIGLD